MPRLDNTPPERILRRVLELGFSKTGKTRWIGEATAAGFNLIYLDGDDAVTTLRELPKEQQSRVFHFDLGDSLEIPRFAFLLDRMIFESPFLWNATKHRSLQDADYDENGVVADEVWEVRLARLTPNDILVVDSWTAYCQSVNKKYTEKLGINWSAIEGAEKGKRRSYYDAAGHEATEILLALKSVTSHLAVICHVDEYQKKHAPPGRAIKDIKEDEYIIDWTRLIPKSISRPHGMNMAKEFTDVARFKVSTGGKRIVDGRPSFDEDGGANFKEPSAESTINTFASLVANSGGFIPGKDSPKTTPAIVEFPPGTYKKAVAVTPASPVARTLAAVGGSPTPGSPFPVPSGQHAPTSANPATPAFPFLKK